MKKKKIMRQREMQLRAEASQIAQRIKFEQNIERMRESGDLDRAAKLLGMAYQVFTQANIFAEETVGLMEKYDILHKKAKTTANNLMQSFDAFNKVMSDMIKDGGSTDPDKAFEQFTFDTEMLQTILCGFMNNDIEVKHGTYYAPVLFLPN